MKTALVFVSNHAKSRLYERFETEDITVLFSKSNRFYRDRFDRMKFYYNLSLDEKNGFVVLVRLSKDKYLIKTITKRGKIDDRDFVRYDRVNIVDQTN